MNRILLILLLTIFTLTSCDKDQQEISYRYSISNQTEQDIATIVLYSFQEENTSINRDKTYSIPPIKRYQSSYIYETKYPYVMLFIGNGNSDYVTRYPSGNNFYKLELDKTNIIEIK